MKTNLAVLATTLFTRLAMALLMVLTISVATVAPAQAAFEPDKFFGCIAPDKF